MPKTGLYDDPSATLPSGFRSATESKTMHHEFRHHFPGPGALDRALRLVRFLRDGCPWDAEQTAESLVPWLLEETHEVVDAIHRGNARELEGELGDLLLNLAFQIVVAEEAGNFNAGSVYAHLEQKMIGRHPELFGGGTKRSWAESKEQERAERAAQGEEVEEGALAGLARGVDPLTKAHQMQERVAKVGFDWEDHNGPASKVSEELDEVTEAIAGGDPNAVEEEVGDLLFAAVNLARMAGTHPTNALARANQKFATRFSRLEQIAGSRGLDMKTAGLEALDAIWNEVKAGEARGGKGSELL